LHNQYFPTIQARIAPAGCLKQPKTKTHKMIKHCLAILLLFITGALPAPMRWRAASSCPIKNMLKKYPE